MERAEDILIAATAGEKKYDQALKALLKNPRILAPILKMTVRELEDMTVEDIRAGIVEVSDSKAIDSTSAAAAANLNVEQGSLSDKIIVFDVYLKLRNPRLSTDGITAYLFIDIEPQNSAYESRLGYPIAKRAVYNVARMLSGQLGVLTAETDYSRLSKCYSIWICNDVPKDQRNTMARFHITKEDLAGESGDREKDYDLMEVVLVRRGDGGSTEGIFDYLAGLFSSDVDRMDRYSHIKNDGKTVEEVKNLGGFGRALAEKNRAIGFSEGEKNGLKKGEEIGLKKGEEIGLKRGEEIGLKKGEEIGIDKGISKAHQDIFDRIIKNLMTNDQSITIDQATEQAKNLMG